MKKSTMKDTPPPQKKKKFFSFLKLKLKVEGTLTYCPSSLSFNCLKRPPLGVAASRQLYTYSTYYLIKTDFIFSRYCKMKFYF